ncbi:MAG: rhomboid family intramembrane serine protease [Candidatus Bathyarchaeota archaeon]|nr:rhomboid family intramembrane serine protease [Candidatus Bathyarchaeota archaeon]MDH5732222.1 rhomboid family intramembrane serine protease [Candidatus Bathyarchaeota archaeon]
MASKILGITYLLITTNLFIYFLELQNPDYYIWNFGLIPALVVQGEYLHTLLTSMFLHGDILHLLLNMLVFLFVGYDCERAIGSSRFLAFYLLSGIVAGLFHAFLDSASYTPTIGASGAIFGILAAYATLFPFRRVIAFFGFIPIPLPAIIFVFLLIVMETAYFVSGGLPYVAHSAHLGGFISGVFLALLFGPKKSVMEEL